MATGIAVGTAFLSAGLQVLFDRLASREVIQFFQANSETPLLNKLKLRLQLVNAVLDDAEEKQITSMAVKYWLDELKDLFYKADDLVYGVVTQALRSKLEAESSQSGRSQFMQLIPITSFNPIHDDTISNVKVILENFNDLLSVKDFLGLEKSSGVKKWKRLPSTSLVEDIYGRDDDKAELIKLLVCDDSNPYEISVIPIVGMGGIGKTTLAQHLYNDADVKQCFDLRAWVCVSDVFDVFTVTKAIFESFTSSTCTVTSLEQLQVDLQGLLEGQKFLLVLDDVWTENPNHWEILRKPFMSEAKGSRIVVTTRNERVASLMRTVPIYWLKTLPHDHCWSLFMNRAFLNQNHVSANPDLVAIGKQIVEKCNGLPLAVKTLGGLLRSKTKIEDWNEVLKNHIWEFSHARSDILPALQLSYRYLPSPLKRCFAYCSLFPKDYEFTKEELVLLWMAEDLLEKPRDEERMVDVGDAYFHELMARCFFQRSNVRRSCFVMHDLINDLAQSVSRKFSFTLGNVKSLESPEKVRYLSYIREEYDTSLKFEQLSQLRCLRTFLPVEMEKHDSGCHVTNRVMKDLLSLYLLRVISFRDYKITELPESIGNLSHIRYLDLSRTSIKVLPKSTTRLYNLQTLLLKGCTSLFELPADMWKLLNLHHLDIRETKLRKMPIHMSRLQYLQTLTYFIVGTDKGFLIRELGHFHHLRGALTILDLQNVVDGRDALEVNLKYKKQLTELKMEWSDDTIVSQHARVVLENLQPPTNLKELYIVKYCGTTFPSWLGDGLFSNIEVLKLDKCNFVSCLPPLGQLSSLKNLSINGISRLVKVALEFYGDGSSSTKPFHSLEVLRFEKMDDWEEWQFPSSPEVEFLNLKELYVCNCRKLTGILPQNLTSLAKLVISECPNLVASIPDVSKSLTELELRECNELVLGSVSGLSSLRRLNLFEFSELKELPFQLHKLSSLTELEIHQCPSLELIPDAVFLKTLKISKCSELICIGEDGRLPNTLKTLDISECRKLELGFSSVESSNMNDGLSSLEKLEIFDAYESLVSFPLALFTNLQHLILFTVKSLESLGVSDSQSHHLTSLVSLSICDCQNIESFPEGGLCTTNLTSLQIRGCKNLKSLPNQMSNLTSLRSMEIWDCPEIEWVSESGIPSNLTKIDIAMCPKMQPREEWGLQRLASLRYISFKDMALVSFPEKGLLPTSLTSLELGGFQNLTTLETEGLRYLTSLNKLSIYNCPKLEWLPTRVLHIGSFSSLAIEGCPLLKQQFIDNNGLEWFNISHIPCIQV